MLSSQSVDSALPPNRFFGLEKMGVDRPKILMAPLFDYASPRGGSQGSFDPRGAFDRVIGRLRGGVSGAVYRGVSSHQ